MKLRFLVSAVVLFVLITVIGGKIENAITGNSVSDSVVGGLVGGLVAVVAGFFFVKKIINF